MTKSGNKGFESVNDFEIDIVKIYDSFVKQIDDLRSNVSLTDKNNQKIIEAALSSKEGLDTLNSKLDSKSEPQESRAHTFYRLIGFPVISNSNEIYNPGFDVNGDLKAKLNIASKPYKDLSNLSVKREEYYNTSIASIFSINKSIDAAVLSLSSSYFVRRFSDCIRKTTGPLDGKSTNQSYSVILKDSNNIDLLTYTDSNGTVPKKIEKTKFHYMKPFFVDPRIELSTQPSFKKVCVPFLNKDDTKFKNDLYLKRPFIEKVIRDRFTVTDQNKLIGSYGKAVSDYIKSNKSIQDIELIKTVTSGDYTGTSDQAVFKKNLELISVMIGELVAAQKEIEQTQSQFHWVPYPTTSGPEYGSTTAPLFVNDPNNLNSFADETLIKLSSKEAIDDYINSILPGQDVDQSDFIFQSFSSMFKGDDSSAIRSKVQQEIANLGALRNEYCTNANTALKIIEIIMGEFSGLGFCDIIAVTAALYIMKKDLLLGFLDNAAFDRVKNINKPIISSQKLKIGLSRC